MKKIVAALGLAAIGILSTSGAQATVYDVEDLTADIGRGFGDSLNRYSWSSEAFTVGGTEYLFIGTFNVGFDVTAIPAYANQLSNAPIPGLAALDAFRRLWSGSPVTPSTGGEIWRYDGWTWDQVLKTDSENVGFRSMTEYDGYVYAATANGPNGPGPLDTQYKALPLGDPTNTVVYGSGPNVAGTEIYRSADGVAWEKVPGGPNSNPLNASSRSMTVIDGKLMLGTENPLSGSELWSFDGTTWALEATVPALAIGKVAEFGGQTIFGTWGSGGGFQLFKLNPDNSLTDITPSFTDSDVLDSDSGVMELIEYNGRFYLTTVDYADGFTMLSTDNPMNMATDSWMVHTDDGFKTEHPLLAGSVNNAYGWTAIVKDGVMYLGTFNSNEEGSDLDTLLGFDLPLDGRGQIWYTEDGTNFGLLEGNGFDSFGTYGFRTSTIWDDELIFGSASNFFLPDLTNFPYHEFGLGPEDFEALLAHFDPELAEHFPFIGTQVFALSRVPEPTTVLLLGLGLAGLGFARRRLH